MDEYYGLEFEDVIADTPCRFKYRKVTPNSFGLSVEEVGMTKILIRAASSLFLLLSISSQILAADDKELNKWCSMQKVDTIRPEQNEKYDLKIYERRGRDLNLKKKFLPSLFAE